MPSKEDTKLFLSETEDLIQNIEDSILAFEESAGNIKAVNELFFAFHTLKGLTGMFGLENLSQFCHHFETFLNKAKESEELKEKSEDFVNLLFSSLDTLRTKLKQFKKGNFKDLDEELLNNTKKAFDNFEIEDEEALITPLDPNELKFIANKKNKKFYKIYIKILSTCVFKKVRLFIILRALNEIGHIIYSEPDPDILQMGEYGSDFSLYFITEKDDKTIATILEEILEIENLAITETSPDQLLSQTNMQKYQKKEPKSRKSEATGKSQFSDLSIQEEFMTNTSVRMSSIDDDERISDIKVDIEVLERLMNYFGELIILKNQVNQILEEKQLWDANRLFTKMDKLFLEIQEIIFQLKLVKVGSTFRRYRRMVRDLAKEYGKQVEFILEGLSVELDRKILEELSSPMLHLLRNAIYHGIETPSVRKKKGKDPMGIVRLRTFQQAGSVFIEVEDDGRGINYDDIRNKIVEQELFSLEEAMELSNEALHQILLSPGFSTLSGVDMVSGRGMGLAIVSEKIRDLGGSLTIMSKKDVGSRFILSVPFTRAIIKAQFVDVAGDLFAIPTENINKISFFDRKMIEYVKGSEFYKVSNKLVPVIWLNKIFELSNQSNEESELQGTSKIAIWCNNGRNNDAILVVDGLKQQMEVVIKPIASKFSRLRGISGVTITGDGSICLIIDVLGIMSQRLRKTENLQVEEIST
ncbi:MAG: chemotaxis protein CheA [Candidatus Helarchaeota archaeon]